MPPLLINIQERLHANLVLAGPSSIVLHINYLSHPVAELQIDLQVSVVLRPVGILKVEEHFGRARIERLVRARLHVGLPLVFVEL